MSCSFYQWVRYVKSGEHTRAIFLSHIRILNNHVPCACMCLSTHFLHVCRNYGFQSVSLTTIYPLEGGSKCICWIFSSSRKHWGTRLLFAGCSRCRWAILLKWSPLPRFRLELASAAVTIKKHNWAFKNVWWRRIKDVWGAHKRKRALKGLLDREPQTILNRRRARKALVIFGHVLGTGYSLFSTIQAWRDQVCFPDNSVLYLTCPRARET